MAESSPNGWKTLQKREKLRITHDFSFSHSIFNRLTLHTRKNQALFGKELRNTVFHLTGPHPDGLVDSGVLDS